MNIVDTVRAYVASQGITPCTKQEFEAALVAAHGKHAVRTYTELLRTLDEDDTKSTEALICFLAPVTHAHLGMFYDGLVGLQTYLREELDAYIPMDADAHIVDAGCGQGLDLGWIGAARPRARVLGYDRSHTQIAVAKERVNRLGLKNVGVLTLAHGLLKFYTRDVPVFVFTNCSSGFPLPSCDCSSSEELKQAAERLKHWFAWLTNLLRVGDSYVDTRKCTKYMFEFVRLIAQENGFALTRCATLDPALGRCKWHPTDPIKAGAYTLVRRK